MRDLGITTVKPNTATGSQIKETKIGAHMLPLSMTSTDTTCLCC